MRWPVVLAMLLLTLPGGLMVFGVGPATLFGVQVPAALPPLAAPALWSGAFQRGFTAWFAQADPVLGVAVAVRNQAYYTLLRQPASPDLLIGPHRELVEAVNVRELCSRTPAGQAPLAEAAALRLAAMQDWYAARHRVFIYLITPNKAGAEPGVIPPGWPCRNTAADRAGLLDLWRAALQLHGVRFIDGPAITAETAATGPIFPRGGTHWNWVAAARFTQAFIDAADRARPGALPHFSFVWHDAPPEGTDRDLADILNLPFPPLDYTTPQVTIAAAAPKSCAPPSIAEVGGSFTFQLDFLLARLPCPPSIALYTYFQVECARFAPFSRSAVDPVERRTALRDRADIVVLEENEDRVFRSRHAEQLWALLQESEATP